MVSVLRPCRLSSSLVEATKVASRVANIEFPSEIISRLHRWKEAKNAAATLWMSPRVERVRVSYNGLTGPSTELSMAKGISTPFDCAKHLSQMLSDRAVIALVDGSPYDMHRSITADVTLDFIHFKDIHYDPTAANLAFWNSSQFVMAAAIESAFKNDFRMRLLSFPKTSLQSGSFVADFRMELDSKATFDDAVSWTPTDNELRALSQIGQVIALTAQPFECLHTKLEETQALLQDNCRLLCLCKESNSKSSTLYRVGKYVQGHAESPLIANSSLIGRFSVVSLRLLGRLERSYVQPNSSPYQLVYRAQGVSIPTAFLTHFTTFDVLMRRARQPNPSVTEAPDYVEPL